MEQPFDWNETESGETRRKQRKERVSLVLLLLLALAILAAAAMLLHSRISAQQGAEISPLPGAAVAAAAELPAESAEPKPAEDGLLVTFLDVGQGDCIFLRAPDGKTMLVDGGPEGSFPVIDQYLSSLGVVGLDFVVASHLHADHIGGLISLVDTYPVGVFYYPPFDPESETYFELLDALQESQAQVKNPLAGVDTLLDWDSGVEVRILAPYDAVYDDFNDTSYMLRVRYGNTAVLLTGDTTEVGERLALKAQPNGYFKADILKVAHHGSSDGTFEEFLEAVSPAIAIICVGADNAYGHPTQALLDRLLERGITIYRTDEDGTISFLLDGTNVTMLK